MSRTPGLTIGEVAARTGLAPSAIRHYEAMGLAGYQASSKTRAIRS